MLHITPSLIGSARLQTKPSLYRFTPALEGAVKVALTLGQPLLVTGEPGTGKTQLAYALADILSQKVPNFWAKPIIFNTKTTSAASDLFYYYDALRHFRDANIRRADNTAALNVADYIELRALGKAIALTNTNDNNARLFVKDADLQKFVGGSVVLIDEIDKAPRDFPNDILQEIENYRFSIKEVDNNLTLQRNVQHPIVVIMTSNSEKNLPEAFLRRCVFHHIEFPNVDMLLQIIKSHLPDGSPYTQPQFIQHFEQLRGVVKKKKPATAELIAWLKLLEAEQFLQSDTVNFDNLTEAQKQVLQMSYAVLVKNIDDKMLLNPWWWMLDDKKNAVRALSSNSVFL